MSINQSSYFSLQNVHATLDPSPHKLQVEHIATEDVMQLHADPENRHATFQVCGCGLGKEGGGFVYLKSSGCACVCVWCMGEGVRECSNGVTAATKTANVERGVELRAVESIRARV